jgi:hypothetical protein
MQGKRARVSVYLFLSRFEFKKERTHPHILPPPSPPLQTIVKHKTKTKTMKNRPTHKSSLIILSVRNKKGFQEQENIYREKCCDWPVIIVILLNKQPQ